MSSREISLWVDERWHRALTTHLNGVTVEDRLQTVLEEMCKELPRQEYERISSEIAEEDRLAREEYEANRKLAIFRIRENGTDTRFLVNERVELLSTAHLLRAYLKGDAPSDDGFAGRFYRREPLTEEQFQAFASERMENTGRVTGAYDIDLDKGIVSTLNIMDGWQSFTAKDISTAAYHAFRKAAIPTDERWDILIEYLEGKALTQDEHQVGVTEPDYLSGERRLCAKDISFAEEIMQNDNLLEFYMEVVFDADKVFGTHVCTDENDDWINVYANYDMEAHCVCDTLEVYLVRGDGSEQAYKYQLNDAEKALLLPEMEK